MLPQDTLRNLIKSNYRRVQELKQASADKGNTTESELHSEIEDLEAKIERWQAELAAMTDSPDTDALSDTSSQPDLELLASSSGGPVIQCPNYISLNQHEKGILRAMFQTCSQVTLLAEFGAGLSGGRVFKTRPKDNAGKDHLPTVVKIGPLGLIRQEVQAYKRWVENRLASIAYLGAWYSLPRQGAWGGLSYELAGNNLDIASLSQYYDQADPEALVWLLKERLFRVMGENWWLDNQAERSFLMQADYDNLLPVNLSITPSDPSPETSIRLITPNRLPQRVILSGQFVQVQGFVINEVERDRLTLNVPLAPARSNQANYRLRVEPAPNLQQDSYQVGQILDIVGRVSRTRQEYLVDYANQALAGAVDLSQKRLSPQPGLILPNPLLAYEDTLNTFLPVNLSTIHGDFNLENIIVYPETGELANLIDFATVRQGHALHDLLRLETEVVTKLIPEALAQATLPPETIHPFYLELHRATFQTSPQPKGVGVDSDQPLASLEKPFTVLTTSRQEARKCFFNLDDATEYYQGLLLYLLGALKFKNLDSIPRAKAVAFWGAATIAELLTLAKTAKKPYIRPDLRRSGEPVRSEAQAQIEQSIIALEAQRSLLGDAVVDASLATLREQLARLEPEYNLSISSANRSPSSLPMSQASPLSRRRWMSRISPRL